MKLYVLIFMACCFSIGLSAQGLEEIKLLTPDKTRGSSMMQAFANRHSDRVFANKKLSVKDLSDLLWAANGVNRADKGMRTAPSALNKQDIDVYVVLEGLICTMPRRIPLSLWSREITDPCWPEGRIS